MKPDKSNILTKLFELPGEIEEGLKMLDKEVRIADHGSIDLLGVDGSKRLVLIEVGLNDDHKILVDVLGLFDWVVRNEDIVRRLYGSSDVDFSQKPRVLVVIPYPSDRFLRISSYFSYLELDLFEYKYIPSLDRLVIEKIDRDRFRPIEIDRERTTQAVKPLYSQLRDTLHKAFDRLEIFESGPISLITLNDHILARVSFTEDFLIIEMPPDAILEIKDESGLDNVVSVLGTRVEKFGISPRKNSAEGLSSLPSLTKQELEALEGVEEKKEADAADQAETKTE